jgi:hypothetical protein
MLMRELSYDVLPPQEQRARALATTLLRAASRLLESLAARLAFQHPAADTEPVLEYHGEAGAPEGALYVNGQLVGHVLGVTRL